MSKRRTVKKNIEYVRYRVDNFEGGMFECWAQVEEGLFDDISQMIHKPVADHVYTVRRHVVERTVI